MQDVRASDAKIERKCDDDVVPHLNKQSVV